MKVHRTTVRKVLTTCDIMLKEKDPILAQNLLLPFQGFIITK